MSAWHRVTLLPSGKAFEVREGEAVLDGALRAGLNLPHSCKGGSCAACRARLVKGAVSYPFGRPIGITAEEEAQGFVLLCEARTDGELSVDIPVIRRAGEVDVKEMPCRVERKQLLAPDVMAVFLRLPAVESFEFLPGQYLDILLPGGRRRSFSIANPPHDSGLIELHVRRAVGGEFSRQVFEALPEKSLLRIQGPLGQFYYRADSADQLNFADRPALLIGGGTGFAPLKSILRHVLEKGLRRKLHLYWGARMRQDLYEDALVREWTKTHPNFSYTPVLSEADSEWTGRTGFVHAAAFADHEDLSAMEVYASGPPAMIDALQREGPARGLNSDRLYFDSFEYSPDALEKIRGLKITRGGSQDGPGSGGV